MSEKNDTVKNLDYYIEHPDEMPTDPDLIAKIMGEAKGVEESKTEPSKEEKKEDKPAYDKKDATPPASEVKSDEAKVDGVITKDGKRYLPYQEMERRIEAARKQGEEASRAAAEAAAKETVEKLQADLKARDTKVAELEKGKKGAEVDALEGIPADLLETIRAEYPTQAKIIEPIIAAIKQRDSRISELTADLQSERENRKKTDAEIAADEVQALIDANTDLGSWQRERPVLFDLAIDTEAKLMGDKQWMDKNPELAKDDAKRYEHVVSLVKQAVGLPAASPKNDNADLDRKAEEVVGEAKPLTPRSLSDIKGGTPPATNVEENLEGASADDIAAHLLKMTPEARERWFARLG